MQILNMNINKVTLEAVSIVVRISSSLKPLGSYLGIDIENSDVILPRGSYAKPDAADTKKFGSITEKSILSLNYP